MQFRNVKQADLEDLLRIEQQGFTQEEAATKQAFIQRIAVISDSFIVAYEGDTIIGYVNGPVTNSRYITDDLFEQALPNPKTGGYQAILGLAVCQNKRQQGLGRALLHELERQCRLKERIGVTLTCKKSLVTYYEQFGYINEGLSSSTHGGEQWFNLVKML